ncbi:MAG: indole-3-glycerol phosphate synthase TrpC [SAR202 cluster bacterium]|nr:indole-3-glycerol phosphate synthase TrpC [SAR202 cluster bacterium]
MSDSRPSTLNPDIPDILARIVEVKRREVERLKRELPVAELERRIDTKKVPLNLSGALMGDRVRIIAECKKASPAKGLLRADYDARKLAQAYVANGAAAISCLTNADHFQGSLADLRAVAEAARPAGVPVLRKEFIFDPYQVVEARANGADAILLIVAMLTPHDLRSLRDLAQKYWLQCLVEVHTEDEMKIALDAGAEIIGINNRDLRTFKTDLAVTERLAKLVPFGGIVVSESGINTPADIQRVRAAGAHAALIGESLVVAPDPGAKLRELLV